MTIVFKQIRNDKDMHEKEGFGLLFIASILASISLFYIPKYFDIHGGFLLGPIILIAIFGFPQLRKLKSDWVKKQDFIGTVTFQDEHVEFLRDLSIIKIQFQEITEIKLHFNYIQGKSYSMKDILHNGIAELNLKTKTDELIVCKFLVESKQQLWELKPIWKNLYLSGIVIKETMFNLGIKTIMFDGDLTDQKIKKYKQELKLLRVYG